MLDDGFCGIEGNRGQGAAKVKLGESSLELELISAL
jgi:hypothetical protein